MLITQPHSRLGNKTETMQFVLTQTLQICSTWYLDITSLFKQLLTEISCFKLQSHIFWLTIRRDKLGYSASHCIWDLTYINFCLMSNAYSETVKHI